MLPAFFHRTPFFRLLLPFVAGIVIGFYITIPAVYCLFACVLFLTGMCLLFWKWERIAPHRWRLLYGGFLHLFILVAGIGITSLQHFVPSGQVKQGVWTVIIEEPPVEKENSVKVTVRIQADLSDGQPIAHDEKVMAYFRKDSLSRTLQQGDLLMVNMLLKPVTNAGNPYEFDYRGYLNRRHIGRTAFVESGQWQRIDRYAQGPLLNLSNRIRTALLDIFRQAGLSGNELAVAEALVLGYKADLDDVLRGAYSASGATHVLAVSGLHVGIIYLILAAVLKLIPFLHRVRWLRAVILIAALWLYALITGMSPSVMRAATMFSFIAVGDATRRRAFIYNSIAASAFVLLLVNPANLFDVGFQLSYLAVIAIVFLHPYLYKSLAFKHRLSNFAWDLTCVSIAAQIGTVPLTLYYFHQFPVYFILSNFVVIPAASVIIYGSLFLFVVSPIAGLLQIVGWALDKFLYFTNSCIFTIEKLPGSLIGGIRFEGWEILFTYLLIAIISVWALTVRKNYLFMALALCLLWVTGATMRDIHDLKRQQLTVYHTQGNSLIQFINGHNNTIWYDSRNPSFNASFLTGNQQTAMHLNGLHCTKLDSVLCCAQSAPDQSGLYVNGNFVQFAGKRIAIFTRNLSLYNVGQQTINADLAILTKNPDIQLQQIIKACNPGIVVIDASNAPYRAGRWEKDCLEAGVKCHRVDKDGAYTLSIR